MNNFHLPCQSQDLLPPTDNSSKDPNSYRVSPKVPQDIPQMSQSDLEARLVYINKNLKSPLSDQPLFKNYLNDEMKSKITSTSTKDLLNFYRIRAEEQPDKKNPRGSSLGFSSDFESGNLERVYLHDTNEYVLFIHPDYGNPKYSHWFYFEVSPVQVNTYRFHIVNINKLDLSLSKGMQIVVKDSNGWHRGGENIEFSDSSRFSSYFSSNSYYTLSFSFTFKDRSRVFFAYSYPYTHTQLTEWLKVLKHTHHDICTVTPLCKTLSGHTVDLVTITSDISLYKELSQNQISDKKAVVLTARVHPCESPSSFIIQGLINFLTGKSFEAKMLRKNFVFKIVPMVNPDGVRYGNTRCSLLGVDLNRRWIEANEILHPEIFYLKELIRQIKEMHDLVVFCDIHSHAKKQNIFMYGCRTSNPDNYHKKKNLISKLIPMLLARKNQNFSFKDSHFKMEKDKESTGRIVVFKEFSVQNSYTLETSFYGRETNTIFNIKDWETIGSDLAQICINLVNPISIKSSLRCALEWYKKIKSAKKKISKNKNKKKILKNKMSIEIAESESDEDSEKLPVINSPNQRASEMMTIEEKKQFKGINSCKKSHHGRSQRNLKASLDCMSSRKITDSFPSIEGIDKKKTPVKVKISIDCLKSRENGEKLPLIKHLI